MIREISDILFPTMVKKYIYNYEDHIEKIQWKSIVIIKGKGMNCNMIRSNKETKKKKIET